MYAFWSQEEKRISVHHLAPSALKSSTHRELSVFRLSERIILSQTLHLFLCDVKPFPRD